MSTSFALRAGWGLLALVITGCGPDTSRARDLALATDASVVTMPDLAQPADAASIDLGPPPADLAPFCASCATYAAPVVSGNVAVAALTEISGLAASRAHPGVLWAHNDSGASAVLYALSTAGAALGEVTLTSATNVDWEDMGLGPCPSGTCLYVADIGDNNANRPEPYALYRIAEPNVGVGAPIGAVSVAAERIEFTYQNGARTDAETMLVHPTTGDVYIVTKRGFAEMSAVYKLTAPLNSGAVAMKLADLAVPFFLDLPLTSGDISPCGNAVLLRGYNAIYRFQLAPGAAFDTIFTTSPSKVTSAGEAQGEALTYSADGRGYYTVSEGSAQPISYMGCP